MLSDADARAWGQSLVDAIVVRIDRGWNPIAATVDACFNWARALMIYVRTYVEHG